VCSLSHSSNPFGSNLTWFDGGEGALNMADKDNAPPRAALMVWHRAWPLAGLAIALLANAAWIGLLTYVW
jgi:hypothetical protein